MAVLYMQVDDVPLKQKPVNCGVLQDSGLLSYKLLTYMLILSLKHKMVAEHRLGLILGPRQEKTNKL